jgi:hypothetical protein
LTVLVTGDLTGEAVPDVTLEGADGECVTANGVTSCSVGAMSGDFDFTVGAPGYAPAQVVETIEEEASDTCGCGCGYVARTVTLVLMQVGDDAECPGVVCGGCLPPLTINVRDAETGEAVADVTMSVVGSCQPGVDVTTCSVSGKAGDYDLTLEAPGYAPAHVVETIEEGSSDFCDCGCGYMSRTVDVEMMPVASPDAG